MIDVTDEDAARARRSAAHFRGRDRFWCGCPWRSLFAFLSNLISSAQKLLPLDSAPKAFISMLRGDKLGKQVVQLDEA